MNKPLKIAFQIGIPGVLPEWEMEMVRNLLHSGVVIFEAFLLSPTKDEVQKPTGIKLFQRFENAWFRSVPDAFNRSAIAKEFDTIPVIDMADTKRITTLNLDVIYRSCLVAGEPDAASFARHGLWFMGFGPLHSHKYEQVAFWEIMNNRHEFSISLLIKRQGIPGLVIAYDGSTTVVPFSVKNTLSTVGWKSSSFLVYRLTELVKTGADLFFSKHGKIASTFQKADVSYLPEYPNSLKLAGIFLRNILRYLRFKILRGFRNQRFTILFSRQELQMPGITLSRFIPLALPRKAFWADPFVVMKENRTYVFFEEYLYRKKKAHISVLELTKEGQPSDPKIVLEKPYHLSYPFIFESGDNLYMIPETSINKRVELYICVDFPYKWEFVQNLMENIDFNDPTLLHHQGRWWLFGTRQNHPSTSSNDQLFLYYSDSFLTSDWMAHPQNPVATKVSNCRPAGNIFQAEGKLYRPAQNNAAARYGYGLKINEIEILNELEYQEKEVFEIVPGRGNKFSAVHTINRVGDLIVIDGII